MGVVRIRSAGLLPCTTGRRVLPAHHCRAMVACDCPPTAARRVLAPCLTLPAWYWPLPTGPLLLAAAHCCSSTTARMLLAACEFLPMRTPAIGLVGRKGSIDPNTIAELCYPQPLQPRMHRIFCSLCSLCSLRGDVCSASSLLCNSTCCLSHFIAV